MTAAERLRFLIEFARMDLGKLREGDRLNLREDLEVFVAGARDGTSESLGDLGGLMTQPRGVPLHEQYPDNVMGELQSDVLKLLEGAIFTPPPPGGAASVSSRVLTSVAVSAKYTVVPVLGRTGGPAGVVVAQGEARDLVLLKAIHLLTREKTAMIRRCPECARVFYKVRRQVYCSRTCVNRANKRTWRAGGAKKARPIARRTKGKAKKPRR